MPGKAYRSLQNPAAYEKLKAKGFTKQSAARISNAQAPGHHVKKRKHKKGALHRMLEGEHARS